jgi:hypothetical protein
MPEARLAMAVAMAEEDAQEEKGIAPAAAPRIDAALPLQDFDWKLKVRLGSEIFITVMWFVFFLVSQFECSCEAGLRSVRVILDANHALWFGFRGLESFEVLDFRSRSLSGRIVMSGIWWRLNLKP